MIVSKPRYGDSCRRLPLSGRLFIAWILLGVSFAFAEQGPRGLIVVGAGGEPAYEEAFSQQVTAWTAAFARAPHSRVTVVGRGENEDGISDLQRVEQELTQAAEDPGSEFWLVLIGHGTFDGKEAKFNLRGPDLTTEDLVRWTLPLKGPHAIIVASAASAPFMAKLSAPQRVVVVATRSGYQQNYVRFGGYLAEAIADPQGDLDRDGQTSLLEAFLSASHRTAEFYKNDRRLATEHALIDDNGDGLGTPADWFRGTRAIKKSQGGKTLDGTRARQWHLVKSPEEAALTPAQRDHRDRLEREIETLRENKSSVAEADYWRRLESMLLELAKIYASPPS